jgi:hypothetical protein
MDDLIFAQFWAGGGEFTTGNKNQRLVDIWWGGIGDKITIAFCSCKD